MSYGQPEFSSSSSDDGFDENHYRTTIMYLQRTWDTFEREKAKWKAEEKTLRQRIAVLEEDNARLEALSEDLGSRNLMLEHALAEARRNALGLGNDDANTAPGSKVDTVKFPARPKAKRYPMLRHHHSIISSFLQEMRVVANSGAARTRERPALTADVFGGGLQDTAAGSDDRGTVQRASAPAQVVKASEPEPTPTETAPADDGGEEGMSAEEAAFMAKMANTKMGKRMGKSRGTIGTVKKDTKPADKGSDTDASKGKTEGEGGSSISMGAALEGLDESLADDTAAKGHAGNKLWAMRLQLRSHLDGVRDVVFHPTDPALLSASEDGTLKYWAFGSYVAAKGKKAKIPDLEPVACLRGHTGAVFCADISTELSLIASGSSDSTVRLWQLPSPTSDLYAASGTVAPLAVAKLTGHTDSVWSVKLHSLSPLLTSASADGSTRVWSLANGTGELVHSFAHRNGTPCSVAYVPHNPNQVLVAYRNSALVTFDLSTGQVVQEIEDLESSEAGYPAQINEIVAHDTLGSAAAACEDGYLRFYDLKTGTVTHKMRGHQKAIGSIALDPPGLYLMTGGHDVSIRFWDYRKQQCVQEVPTHRRAKYDEAVNTVAYHAAMPLTASGGGDATVRLYG